MQLYLEDSASLQFLNINTYNKETLCLCGERRRQSFGTKGNGQIYIYKASGSLSTSLLAVKDLQTANPDEPFTAPSRD